LTLKTKLLVSFLVVGLLPLCVVTILALSKAGRAMEDEATAKFTAIQEAKKAHLESYFQQVEGALRITRDDPIHMAVLNISDSYKMNVGSFDNDGWRSVAEQYDPRMQSILKNNGWHDLFLINKDGTVVYAAARKADIGRVIKKTTVKATGMGKVFSQMDAAEDNAIVVSDFESDDYADGQHASFMMAKLISESGQLVGYVALQLFIDQINAIVQQRSGMGRTGESYLVGRLNRDATMRSNRIVGEGKIGDTVSEPFIIKALDGQSGSTTVLDAHGAEMFVRYDPLQISGLNWCMVSTVRADEMLSMVSALRNTLIIFMAIVLVAVIVFSLWVTAAILGPIRQVVAMLKDIAEGEGDLTKRMDVKDQGEIGDMSNWFNSFMEKLQVLIKQIATNAETLNEASTGLSDIAAKMSDSAEAMSSRSQVVASAAEEMSANLGGVAAASEEAATNVHFVASATEEMTATVGEIAQNSEKARTITASAVSRSEKASDKVGELGRAANEISKVTEVITEISDQTNLLALNATIEAARAGEAGKGFAVVANEIKDLANQTAHATKEIKSRIDSIQGSTSDTVIEIKEISNVINDVDEIVGSIAAAVDEQSMTSKEISGNVMQAAQGIQEVNENVNQSSTVAKSISQDIAEVNNSGHEISSSSGLVNMNADELSKLADNLQGLVNRFKVE
jgi:methyl-accepting chemotaxis protein